MIRTEAVVLETIRAAAYRQKLTSGGSGVVVVMENVEQPGLAEISKTSGEAIPSTKNPKGVYPKEAFDEAIAKTAGMPYKNLGKFILDPAIFEEPEEEPEEIEIIIDSNDYQMIVDKYTDKNGKFSYDLFNKDLIKFINSSSVARKMIEDGESAHDIAIYSAGCKFRSITGNHNMTDAEVEKIVELLDEVSPKGIFKDLNEEIRKKQNPRR